MQSSDGTEERYSDNGVEITGDNREVCDFHSVETSVRKNLFGCN